jgi:hypothetical protein
MDTAKPGTLVEIKIPKLNDNEIEALNRCLRAQFCEQDRECLYNVTFQQWVSAKNHQNAIMKSSDGNFILKIACQHSNKLNKQPQNLGREIEYIRNLTAKGVECVPKLVAEGQLPINSPGLPICLASQLYIVIPHYNDNPELKSGTDRPQFEFLALEAFFTLLSHGYLHGDFKDENVLYDGKTLKLVDFDQTVYNTNVACLSPEQLLHWSETTRTEMPWCQCGSLAQQLENFSYSKYAGHFARPAAHQT